MEKDRKLKVVQERIISLIKKGASSRESADIYSLLNKFGDLFGSLPDSEVFNFSMNLIIEDEVFGIQSNETDVLVEQRKIDYPDFSIKMNKLTFFGLVMREIDAIKAYFQEKIEFHGDLYYAVRFMDILHLKILNLFPKTEMDEQITPSTIKTLLEVYQKGIKTANASHIPLFNDIFCLFVNHNPSAQKSIENHDILFEFLIHQYGKYFIQIQNSEMKWSESSKRTPDLIMMTDIDTSAGILIKGDAMKAFLEGKIQVGGNSLYALFYLELILMFLEFLNIIKLDD